MKILANITQIIRKLLIITFVLLFILMFRTQTFAAKRPIPEKITVTAGQTYKINNEWKSKKGKIKWKTRKIRNHCFQVKKRTQKFIKIDVWGEGTGTIIAKINGKEYYCKVKAVMPRPSISKTKMVFKDWKSRNISISRVYTKPVIKVSNNKIIDIKQHSSYHSPYSASEYYKVYKYTIIPKKYGTTYVYFDVNGRKLKCEVVVYNKHLHLYDIPEYISPSQIQSESENTQVETEPSQVESENPVSETTSQTESENIEIQFDVQTKDSHTN